MSIFRIAAFVPDYQRSDNRGDDRRVAVGIRAADVVCSACGSTFRATPSRNPEAGHFRVHGGNFTLLCESQACGQQELIAFRPLLLQAKGQHTVTVQHTT
jgi:hypothetical protein